MHGTTAACVSPLPPPLARKGDRRDRDRDRKREREAVSLTLHSRLCSRGYSCSPGHWPSGQTWRMASQMWLQDTPAKSATTHFSKTHTRGFPSGQDKTYLTWTISSPSLTSWGRSLTSLRFWAGSSTVLTPARSAPISFSLIPPTAVMRPRREISPCVCATR